MTPKSGTAIYVSQKELFHALIKPVKRCLTAGCRATASIVQSSCSRLVLFMTNIKRLTFRDLFEQCLAFLRLFSYNNFLYSQLSVQVFELNIGFFNLSQSTDETLAL